MKGNRRLIASDGPCCRQCGKPSEVYEHVKITPKELKKLYYYSEWYICRNPDCKTTTWMIEDYRVFSNEGKLMKEGEEQTSLFFQKINDET